MSEKKVEIQIDLSAEALNDVPPMVPGSRRNPSREVYNMSFRMAPETAELLNKIASERNTTMQDLVGYAVDTWLREENLGVFKQPPLKRATRKAS
jgi:hypothetical protein